MHWLQDSIQNNVNYLNNVIREARNHYWKSRKKYLKAEFNELEQTERKRISETFIVASMS